MLYRFSMLKMKIFHPVSFKCLAQYFNSSNKLIKNGLPYSQTFWRYVHISQIEGWLALKKHTHLLKNERKTNRFGTVSVLKLDRLLIPNLLQEHFHKMSPSYQEKLQHFQCMTLFPQSVNKQNILKNKLLCNYFFQIVIESISTRTARVFLPPRSFWNQSCRENKRRGSLTKEVYLRRAYI